MKCFFLFISLLCSCIVVSTDVLRNALEPILLTMRNGQTAALSLVPCEKDWNCLWKSKRDWNKWKKKDWGTTWTLSSNWSSLRAMQMPLAVCFACLVARWMHTKLFKSRSSVLTCLMAETRKKLWSFVDSKLYLPRNDKENKTFWPI